METVPGKRECHRMSFGKGGVYAATTAAIEEAGLKDMPRQLLGKSYRFVAEHGSHHQILFGTVTAINISDESGLELFVTSPTFFGLPLVSLRRSDGNWYVCTKGSRAASFKGELMFL